MTVRMARRLLAAGVLAAALASSALAAPGAVEDDWPRALAEAKRLGVPILVDVWAPW
jgi:hypothetical protein